MTVLCIDSPLVSFGSCPPALFGGQARVERASDGESALWLLAGRDYRCVVVDLRAGALQWETIAAALWRRPPARVVALAGPHVDADLRRRAYGAGVWELLEIPACSRAAQLARVAGAVRRALQDEPARAVLFVDDCIEITRGIGGLLAGEGMKVDAAATERAARRMMSERRYALVIAGTRRTGSDGFWALRETARLQPGVPVIVLAAAVDDGTFLRAVEMGASACLWKLAEPEEIVRAVQGALGTVDEPRGSEIGEDR